MSTDIDEKQVAIQMTEEKFWMAGGEQQTILYGPWEPSIKPLVILQSIIFVTLLCRQHTTDNEDVKQSS